MTRLQHSAIEAQSSVTCVGHSRPVVDVHFSALDDQGKYYMISASKDNKAMIREGCTGDWIGTLIGHQNIVWSARLSRYAHRAVTGSADFFVKVWDTNNGQELVSFENEYTVRTVNFNPDATRIVAGGHEKKLKIYDLYRPDAPALEGRSYQGTIRATVWHPSHQSILFSGCEDGNIRVHDTRIMRSHVTCFPTSDAVSCINLTTDGETVYWAAKHQVYFWSLALGFSHDPNMITRYEMSKPVKSMSVHPNGEKFVYGSEQDSDIHICDAMSGKELETYQGHKDRIHSVSYSPDGELFATGSEDSHIRLWQTNPTKSYGLWQITDT
ncbi:WD40 repeat-like protein [Lichtheimia hyalospora FSU 10163]|nr:WD40 repeat-like protein [Lichtheimia hyalospora FSU 10163]